MPRPAARGRARRTCATNKKTRVNPFGTNLSVLPPNFTALIMQPLCRHQAMPSFCNGKAPSDATQGNSPSHPLSVTHSPAVAATLPPSAALLKADFTRVTLLLQRFSLLNCHHYNSALTVCQYPRQKFFKEILILCNVKKNTAARIHAFMYADGRHIIVFFL